MKRVLAVVAGTLLALAVATPAIAADETLPHDGQVLISVGGDTSLPAGDHADVVVVVGGDLRLRGEANVVVIVDGTGILDGAVVEELVVVRGEATLTDTRVVSDIRTLDATVEQRNVDLGGSVKGLEDDLVAFGWFIGAAAVALWVGVAGATVVAGLLMAALAARQVRTAEALISREPVTTGLVGLLAIVVPPIVALLLAATVVGIPLAAGLVFGLWPLAAFVGYVVAAIWIGDLLLARLRGDGQTTERPYLAAVLGLAVAFVVGLVPIVTAVISIFGLGAVVLAAWRTVRGPTARRPAAQAQPAPMPG